MGSRKRFELRPISGAMSSLANFRNTYSLSENPVSQGVKGSGRQGSVCLSVGKAQQSHSGLGDGTSIHPLIHSIDICHSLCPSFELCEKLLKVIPAAPQVPQTPPSTTDTLKYRG